MAAPAAAAAATSGALKPMLKIIGASLATLVAAGLIAVPLLLSLVFSLLAAPVSGAAAIGGPLVVGSWGTPEANYSVTAGFGYVDRSGCSICSEFHRGVDISAGCGAPVYAAGPGVVTAAGWDTGGYGNRVMIDHGGGIVSMYGHMPIGGIGVTVGQKVKAGDQLGIEGSTGKSTGCHLHFEIRSNDQSIDPLAFMRAREIRL